MEDKSGRLNQRKFKESQKKTGKGEQTEDQGHRWRAAVLGETGFSLSMLRRVKKVKVGRECTRSQSRKGLRGEQMCSHAEKKKRGNGGGVISMGNEGEVDARQG